MCEKNLIVPNRKPSSREKFKNTVGEKFRVQNGYKPTKQQATYDKNSNNKTCLKVGGDFNEGVVTDICDCRLLSRFLAAIESVRGCLGVSNEILVGLSAKVTAETLLFFNDDFERMDDR